MSESEVIAQLRNEIAQKDSTINMMKEKTKEFVTKLKADFQVERDEKDAQLNTVRTESLQQT